MVFQSYALYPHLTVKDNMGLGLKQAGAAKDEIDDARRPRHPSMLSLEPYLARRPAELSGGQRQRVAIGRAIVREPKLFLFDEPLSNLDAALRVQTRLEIARLHRSLKATMIYVTHDQVEAMTLADKIVVLNAGRDRADRLADGTLQQAGQYLRRRLHRLAADEFHRGRAGSASTSAKTIGVRPEHLTLSREQRRLAAARSSMSSISAPTRSSIWNPSSAAC